MPGSALEVDASNAEQARAWDGEEGRVWADRSDAFDDAVARYEPLLLQAAGLGPEDRVLDLGCGTGQSTVDAARLAPLGSALGVDLSAAMLAVARKRAEAEGLSNVAFLQADAQTHDFAPGSFDVAISRFGAMFFGDPVRAFGNVAGALPSRGRLALLTWQSLAHNEWLWLLTEALTGAPPVAPPPEAPSPFALADPERVRRLLGRAGFGEVWLTAHQQPVRFGPDPAAAENFVLGLLGWRLAGLDPSGRSRAVQRLRGLLERHHGADGVCFGSAAWIVTARKLGVER